jgi:hypothetical protein
MGELVSMRVWYRVVPWPSGCWMVGLLRVCEGDTDSGGRRETNE